MVFAVMRCNSAPGEPRCRRRRWHLAVFITISISTPYLCLPHPIHPRTRSRSPAPHRKPARSLAVQTHTYPLPERKRKREVRRGRGRAGRRKYPIATAIAIYPGKSPECHSSILIPPSLPFPSIPAYCLLPSGGPAPPPPPPLCNGNTMRCDAMRYTGVASN